MQEQATTVQKNSGNLQIKLARIYARDISLEVPVSFEALMKELNKPDSGASFEPNLNFRSTYLSENFYETTAHLKLTVRAEDMVLYLLEVQLVGVFSVKIPENLDSNSLEQLTQTIIFPHLSELVNDLTSRTSFPAINLINLLGVFDIQEGAN